MQKKERFQLLIDYFTTHFPEPQTELSYHSPYELLVAVILSAQCTDKRVNQLTPALFERFPDPAALAASNAEEVFTYVRSVSYPNNKSKHLVGTARMLLAEFGGEVPPQIDALQRLPGVGRKTAHVVASIIFNQPAMAVDTHVFRVSHRLGLAPLTATTPLAVEKHLTAYFPKALIAKAHHWLILHGRYVCVARRPKCHECALTALCKYYQKELKKAEALPPGSAL